MTKHFAGCSQPTRVSNGACPGHTSVDVPRDLLIIAMNVKAARDDRRLYLDPCIFGEAAWDMLLALYIACGRGYRLCVSNACFESGVPQTTALRWLDYLVKTGLAEKRQNAMDNRSAWVLLTAQGLTHMTDYLTHAADRLSRTERV